MAVNDNAPAGTNVATLTRIIAATEIVERGYRNDLPQAGRRRAGVDIRIARTTSPVTASSGGTMGTGSADLYHVEDGVMVADSPAVNVVVKNWSGVSISSARWCLVMAMGGTWVVIAVDC